MSGRLTRDRWDDIRVAYDRLAEGALEAENNAADAIGDVGDDEDRAVLAQAYAQLAISRRVEALAELLLAFLEPPERDR